MIKTMFNAHELLALCVAVDEQQGFKYVKSHEQTEEQKSNFSLLLEGIKTNTLVATEEHHKTASEIIDYFEGLVFKAMQRELSEFEQKIVELIKADDINLSGRDSRLPIAPSLPSVYRNNVKHDSWSDKERSLRSVSDYVGTVGSRDTFEGKIVMSRFMHKTNSMLVAVLLDDKNIVKFFYDLHRGNSSKDMFSEGKNISFSAFVKSHEVSDFSKCKETFVNRVTLS